MCWTPCLQALYMFRNHGWKFDDDVVEFCRRRNRRILGTRMIKEGNRAQATLVRRSPVHRVSHRAALFALHDTDLLPRHCFRVGESDVAQRSQDLTIDQLHFVPDETHSWDKLKQIKGWDPRPSWYSPEPDGSSDTVGDLSIAQRAVSMDDMEAIHRYTPLMRGLRLIVQQNVVSEAWFVALGIISDCCPIAIPLIKCEVGTAGACYWALDLVGDPKYGWRPLVCKSLDDWVGAQFVLASPEWQACQEPRGRWLESTGGGVIVLASVNPVEPLIRVAARAAFDDIGATALQVIASGVGIALAPAGEFFDLLFSFVQQVFELDDAATLRFLKQRTINIRNNLKALEHFGHLADVMAQDEKKGHTQLKEDESRGENLRKSCKAKWKAKRVMAKAAIAAAKAKAKATKTKKAGAAEPAEPPVLDDIALVRARVRPYLPDTTIKQHEAKELLPPRCNAWNNWRGQAWCIHLVGHPRVSELWCHWGMTALFSCWSPERGGSG